MSNHAWIVYCEHPYCHQVYDLYSSHIADPAAVPSKQTDRKSTTVFGHQYSHRTLFATCTMLHNVVQLLQVNKLQTKPAMLRFRQVAASKLFHDLLWPLHSICHIQSSSIYIPNTTREPEQFFIYWCCCCHHWWRQWLFLICVMLNSLKRILSQQFYSIYALDLLATCNSSIGCHRLSQSWDPRLVNLLRLVGKRKSGQKARKGRNLFVVMSP